MKIAGEGYPFIIGSLVPGAALAGLYPVHHWVSLFAIGIVLIIFALACSFFFRNPRREIPTDESVILSPADGRVVKVKPIEDDFVGRGHRVDIFLSVLDAHLNRIPTSGTVDFVRHRPGRFFSAFKDKASEYNERTDIGISGKRGRFRVAQIAGSIARRIVCRVGEKDVVQAGQLYGMIRFGSRTEISFPECFAPCVKPGEHVKAGESIVGKLVEDA